jgi:RNA polymerase sigma factor (sigma-70 family)
LSGEDLTPRLSASPVFVTTRWTHVLQARGDSAEAKAALSDLCAGYYATVFAFIRRREPDDDSARDLTQEFFARLLARGGVDTVDPERGRFRSFLLGAVKHFLTDVRDYDRRLKRGAGHTAESIDALQVSDSKTATPDQEFDHQWALTLLDRAFAAMTQEYKQAGKSRQFETLKPWLTGDTENIAMAEAAGQLEMTEGAVKVAIHRLRRRLRDIIKSEISQTVKDPTDIESEMHDLLEALL